MSGPSKQFGHNDILAWAQDGSTTLDFNVFPTYAVIKVKEDPEMIWLVRDGVALPDSLIITILDAYFQENYEKPLLEAA